MLLRRLTILCALILTFATVALGAEKDEIARRPWFEARSAHFNIYSCGTKQEVNQLAARLEQFHDAYGLLAGAQAVSAPSITVMAFPDQAALEPFLPLYQGKPANLSGFFKRSSDENLIVLALTGTNTGSMQTIFHEYTHLLFRHNDRFWPLWLQEGMAEIYSTFDVTGRGIRIGKPINYHLALLTHVPMMPLKELLNVTHDSPDYNETEHQGVFYAESWLLTHFLMNGDNPALKARFGQFTKLLRQGQSPEAAFTNSLGLPLSAIETQLKHYLDRRQFEPLSYVLAVDLSAPRQVATRPVTPVETCFRLGNELMRIGRLESAETYFNQGQKLAPASPLISEGLGLLAIQRHQPEQAVKKLKESLQHGSTSFLAHYFYAKERFAMTSDGNGGYTRVEPDLAADIRGHLQQSITLMPSFAPAHEQLGFFEIVQGENPALAAEQMQRAIQLEPENQWYLLYLAEAQAMGRDIASARRTLQILREPHVESKLRAQAEETLKEIDSMASRTR